VERANFGRASSVSKTVFALREGPFFETVSKESWPPQFLKKYREIKRFQVPPRPVPGLASKTNAKNEEKPEQKIPLTNPEGVAIYRYTNSLFGM
jgi:hypothetical protein